ncbi:ATP-grasp domain-containing protein [Photobacterium halotolerans]|uniref:ATP-grasp domain-containing protein n=1 Tax=Photobacterium halotolerans TaxID=265726 RepID=A0A7X4WTA7_9GAMM|nr:ATP-grasp domain-containing protein [Photobacterium halotolerans]NAW67667.1 ATP-grasp domain-containing protein [Photobacterium halotolerans]NAW88422.1 ATP-grasp domain-containing protein [Photobacterium halotolerans]NAX49006.1 ATP-grasp domain-containing protein [Photobacterium halotolerans]
MKVALLTFHNFFDVDIERYFSGLEVDLFIFTSKVNAHPANQTRLPSCCKAVYCVDNYMNNGQIAFKILQEHQKAPFTHILYLGEDDVLRTARLAHHLGLPGLSLEAAQAYRDKCLMKRHLLNQPAVRVPKFAAINSELDLIAFTEEVGFPVFVKPRTSSGSMFARKIADQHQLSTFLETQVSSRLQDCEYQSDLIVEEYIEGKMYHIDGFIGAQGQPLCLYPSKYVSDNLQLNEISHSQTLVSIMLEQQDPLYAPLIAQTQLVIAALPDVANVPFHAEFFVTDNNDIIFCEIACRTGGAGVNQAVYQATGNDLNKLYIRTQLGAREKLSTSASKIGGWCLINPSNYLLPTLPAASEFHFLEEMHFYYTPGTVVNRRAFSGEKVAKAIAAGDGSEEVQHKLFLAHKVFMEKSRATPV